VNEISQILTPERSRVRRALAMLGLRYPGGLDWLERRLDDIESGRAQLWQAGLGKAASGWAIVTPKGAHQVKLSTILVAPPARGQGLGRKLLDAIQADWCHHDVLTARVTVDENDTVTRGFFEAAGFRPLADGRRQYGARYDCTYSLDLDALGSLSVAAN